ncbi:unnamed protein product [Trichobilharzia szidati]|nr:unnamed protein product [Trichobilharzia szidati]
MDLGYMQRPRVVFRNNILNTRAQLLEVFFRRIALGYTSVFSLTARRLIEFVFLVQAVFVLVIFIHLHITFVKSPITCLDSLRNEFSSVHKSESDSPIKSEKTTNTTPFSENSTSKPSWSWLRYGILRIEVIPSPDPSYSLADSYAKEFYGTDTEYTLEVDSEQFPTHDAAADADDGDADKHSDNSMLMVPILKNSQHSVISFGGKNLLHEIQNFWHAILTFPSLAFTHIKKDVNYIVDQIYIDEDSENDWSSSSSIGPVTSYNHRIHSFKIKIGRFLSIFKRIVVDVFVSVHQFFRDILTRVYTSPSSAATRTDDDSYIIEYALEYGFLRLSPQARKQFNITVKLVVLDPQSNPCFGGVVSRFLMDEFLGYEDLLIGSIKYLSATEGLKGYVVNVMNGQHYRLVAAQMSWSSYFAAGFIMLLFT